ncbi:MAG: dihydrolipoyl dehydrogenase [Deltaproteobacteria bacterium]
MMDETYDMAVIGGGPAGYVAALRGRQLGLSVILLEKERIGGVCLNRGCIPTKAILSDMEGVRWCRRAAREGILDRQPRIDFSRLMHRKDVVVEKMVSNLEEHLAKSGVRTLQATAGIVDAGAVATEQGEIVRAKNIVIASGSRPWTPPIAGADSPGVIGTRQALNLEKLPSRLVIIGGGIIGQEFAAIFSSTGCRVTVLEALNRILSEVDSEIARKYASLLPGRGISTEVGVTVRSIEKVGDVLKVAYEKKSKEKTADADLVLMATGRRPFFENSGVAELGVDMERGAIRVDRFLRTSVPGIYAIGDVVGKQMLAHLASYHGEVAAENIAGHSREAEDDLVPACVFTMPQIAWVGLTEEQAVKSGRPFRTSTFSLSASGKAIAMGESRGWLKVLEDRETGRLIGAHFMGPAVSELVGEITLAIRKGMSAADIVDTIHPHPTISEAMREAALGFLDGPIHAASRTKSYEGDNREPGE